MDLSGSWRRARSFAAIDAPGEAAAARLPLLIGVGVTMGALKAAFDYDLHLPGHHGLETMALLMIARLGSNHRFASVIAASSGAVTAMGLGATDGALWPLFFLLPALFLDLSHGLTLRRSRSAWTMALLGAGAFALKPLAKVLISAGTGAKFGSLAAGLPYPLVMHLVFGFAGSLAGVLMWKGAERLR